MNEILQPLILILDGALICLSLSFTLIMVWYDVRRTVSQLFALLVLLVVIWNMSVLFQSTAIITSMPPNAAIIAYSTAQMGFSGAAVTLYILTGSMVGILRSRYALAAVFILLVMLAYQGVLLVSQLGQNISLPSLRPTYAIFFLLFHALVIYLLWYYRRRTANTTLSLSAAVFVVGQVASLVNQSSDAALVFSLITNLGILGIGSSIFRQAIIAPLKSQSNQIEALHHVSMTISRHIAPATVLQEIARQASAWLDATAACIFLREGERMSIVALHDLPQSLYHRVAAQGGIADTAAREGRALWVEHYRTGWRGADDFSEWSDVFGSVICVPMKTNEGIIGTILSSTMSRAANTPVRMRISWNCWRRLRRLPSHTANCLPSSSS
ncbi:GAF domain-containing protein [bacterium]|nr:GAF domain-containing protein [bacterium]